MVNVWTLLLVRRTFIVRDERRFRTYVTDTLESVNNCYAIQDLDNGHIELLGVKIGKHKNFEMVK